MKKHRSEKQQASGKPPARRKVLPALRIPGEALSGFASGWWHAPSLLLLIAALVAGLYGHTLPFPFVFDDCVYLKGNPFAFGTHRFGFLTDPLGFAMAPSKMGMDPDYALNIMLRPFAYFTFYLNYLRGGLDPGGFRLANIMIHAANGWLVFLILRHFMERSEKRASVPESTKLFIPVTVALLFVAHPLQTESVTYVIQRFTSMCALFCLLALWLHLRAGDAASRTRSRLFRAASVVAIVLAMLTKESALTVPAMIMLLDWAVMGTDFKTALRRALPLLACTVIVPALVLFASWAGNDGKLSLGAALNIANEKRVPRSHYEYVLTSLRIVIAYLRLIVVPTGLNLDPDVKWSTSLADWRVLLSGGAIVGLLAGVGWNFCRRHRDLRASLVFAFTICFFAFLATSSGLAPLPDVMAEHRTYTPSVAALVVLVCLIDAVRTSFCGGRFTRLIVPCAVVVWVVVLSVATRSRNEVWRSELALWTDTTTKSPGNWRPWFNLGCACSEANRLEEAESCLRRVLAIEPRVSLAYSNLAAILINRKKQAEALELCRDAQSRGFDTPELGHMTGLAQCLSGRVDEGVQSLLRVLDRRPDDRQTHVILGSVYDYLHREDLALAHLRKAASLGPDDPVVIGAIREVERKVSQRQSDTAAR